MKLLSLFLATTAFLLAGRAGAACPSPTADQIIKLPGRPFAAEPSADNCRLFVSLIDGPDNGVVALLTNEGGAFRLARTVKMKRGSGGGVALSHDGALLAVAAEDAAALLDVARLESADQDPIVATLSESGLGAIYAQFTRDDAHLFVSEERNASVAVIDVAAAGQGRGDKAIVGRVPVGQAPVGLALSPDGTRLYSTSETIGPSGDCKPEQEGGRTHAEGVLLSIDVARATSDPSRAMVKAIRAGCSPVRVVTSADGRILWVSQRGDGRVMGLDASALDPGAPAGRTISLAVGRSPVGLALRPDGAQLWVANSDRFAKADGSLAVVMPASPAEARLSGTLKVGAFPRDLRFMPDGRTLVVALFGAGAVMLHPTGDATAVQPAPAGR